MVYFTPIYHPQLFYMRLAHFSTFVQLLSNIFQINYWIYFVTRESYIQLLILKNKNC
jgi:hypothetical protein